MDWKYRIDEEMTLRRKAVYADLITSLESRKFLEVRHYFLYYSKAETWETDLANFIHDIDALYAKADGGLRTEYLKLLVFLAIDLKSHAVQWVLAKEHDPLVMQKGHDKILLKIHDIVRYDSKSACRIHTYFKDITAGKLIAEDVAAEDIALETSKTCGKSLDEFINNSIKHIQSSNIPRLRTGDPNTAMIRGNDYGEYLNDTLWLGISYATTNPPLVNMVWDIDREFWKSKLRIAAEEEPDSDLDPIAHLCCLATVNVVEKNCRLLRSIFYATQGSEGYVCYQVNPHNHDSAENMICEVDYAYKLLEKRLEGIPNVSFKLPATFAGLKAANALSYEGFPLTITLEFGLFQALAFAEILKNGSAITSNLVVMNGRLAFPVRDELLAAGVDGAEAAAQWAGIEVTRKLFRLLYKPQSNGGMGLDSQKIRIMNASLRIYGGQIPDISELTGPQIMSIFPNVRRAWDIVNREFSAGTIENETPEQYLTILKKSEIFRQAWWTEDDEMDGRPETILHLSEEEKVRQWVPIKATLDQFLAAYDTLENHMKQVLKFIV